MRDCKGIKILLAICPCNYRSEDFLIPTEGLESETEPHELSESLFLLFWFPAGWASCHFLCIGFSSHSASTTGALTKLGFCCAWLPPHGGWHKFVSARLNLNHCTVDVGGVCNFLGSVSPQQKFEVTYDWYYSSVLFGKQRKIQPWGMMAGHPKDRKRREARGSILVPLFIYFFFFSPPPDPALCKLVWPGGCLSYLRSSLWFLDLPVFCFHGLFPSLSFSHRYYGLLVPILTA